MIRKIELEMGCEKPIFETLLINPEKILLLPKGYYERFIGYMLQEQMYEDIPKLERIKDKISDKTFDELLECFELIELK